VPLAEDRDAVGELGSGCPHELFGKQFARGHRGGIFPVSIPAPAKTASNDAEVISAVADEDPEPGGTVAEVHQQVAGLLGGPRSSWVTGRPEDVHVAAVDFQGEDVEPFEGDGAADVEEVHGQHGRGLGAEEPAPGRVRGSGAALAVFAAA
jgi:hypothetical protein